MMVTLEEAKQYLRVDGDEDDELILSLINTAKELVQDISRLEDDEFLQPNEIIHLALMYTVAYLYEHRERASHKELTLTLRALLQGIREVQF